jgi:lipopolysaccharide assembly outer membrane protein LptD (OstA)
LSSGRTITLRQLPEVEYKLRPTQLGKLPLFVDLDSSLHYLSVERTETYRGEYGRADLFPQLTVPLTTWPWLSVSIKGGARLTWYGDSLGADEAGATAFVGEQLTRVLPVASAEVVGPSFSRVFEKEKGFFGKYKHVVEPRFQYAYIDDFEDQDQLPLFDQVDSVRGRHDGRVALINRLLAKPKDPKDGGSREVLSLELGRRYSLDPERFLEQGTVEETLADGTVVQERKTSTSGPLEATLRSYPSDSFGLRLDARYSVLFGELTSMRLSTLYRTGPYRLSLSWAPRYRATTGETLSNQATLGFSTPIVPRRLTLTSNLNYDFERQLLRDQRHHLVYTGSCFTFRLEYHQSETASQLRRDWVFSLDLKNVGTFLDFNGGESEYY